jgi:hypothetical protein
VLFAFDLDKTLVTNDFQLPDRIGSAVRALRDRGHLVTVLTGRPMNSARRFLDALEVTGPFSVNHGAQVMGPNGAALRRTATALGRRAHDRRPVARPPPGRVQLHHRRPHPRQGPADERWGWAHTESRVVTRFLPTFDLDADKVVFASSTSAAIAAHVAERVPHVERYLWGTASSR